MDTESALCYLNEINDDLTMEIFQEWNINKGNPEARQAWKVIPANLLIKEWNYNYRTGQVHEKAIERIQEICITNYCKLLINTVLFGHSPHASYYYFESWIDEDWTEQDFKEWLEDFEWFACDDRGNWRISDYGLEPIGNYVLKMIEEEDYSKKLYWIDLILNVTHQRSNLASWFVEGGSTTLSALASNNELCYAD